MVFPLFAPMIAYRVGKHFAPTLLRAVGGTIGSLFGKKYGKVGRRIGIRAGKAVRGYKGGGQVYNKRPLNFVCGGPVNSSKGMSRKQMNGDSVLALLQPGEIVKPRPHVKKAVKWLHASKIKLPGIK